MNEKKLDTLSIISLVCSIAGFFIFGIYLGIVAIITGIISFERKLGKAGFIVGLIDVIGVIILLS